MPVLKKMGPRSLLACSLAGHAFCRLPLTETAAVRKRVLTVGGATVPPVLLKHADEQALAALFAVDQAMRQLSAEKPVSAAGWGVVGATRYLARAAFAQQLQRYRSEGAWGVSPHVIPHRSLHSLSGLLSLILKTHGPNFGVGGGEGGVAEGLLAAMVTLEDQRLPGVWFVACLLDPEQNTDAVSGQPVGPADAVGLALALVPHTSPLARHHLEFESEPTARPADLAQLSALCQLADHNGSALVPLGAAGAIEIRRPMRVPQLVFPLPTLVRSATL